MYKKVIFICKKCLRDDFKSARGLAQHGTKAHPYVPPPPPVRTVQVAPFDEELHNFFGGNKLQVGDVVYFARKAVIRKIIKTEGSNIAEVTLAITKKWWSETEIS
jgi:hypothetical protein